MGKPLAMDLRKRALAAVDAGISRRAAAGRFGVSVSSVIRWDARRRATGSFEPKPQGGDMRSRRIEARHADVMAAFEEERDQSLEELRARLAERGIAASSSALSRFFQRHGMTRKKRMARPVCKLVSSMEPFQSAPTYPASELMLPAQMELRASQPS